MLKKTLALLIMLIWFPFIILGFLTSLILDGFHLGKNLYKLFEYWCDKDSPKNN